MKNFLFIGLLFISSISIAQTTADSIYHKRLYHLCKVWGHAKYFHSKIANGSIDWDNALLTTQEKIKNVSDNTAFNNALLEMLHMAGNTIQGTGSLPSVEGTILKDNTWMQDNIFSSEVQSILLDIKSKFRPQKNAYVDQSQYGSTPVFEKDDKFYTSSYDKKNNLLALFRYWNIINTFYPYKFIMDQNWDTTLQEFIPKILQAESELDFILVFKEFTTKINDSHSFFVNDLWYETIGENFPPFSARYIENEMVVTNILSGITTIKKGDIIKSIDGKDIHELRDSLRKYISGSNDPRINNELNYQVLRGKYGNFTVTVDNGSNIHQENFIRNGTNSSKLRINNTPRWKILERKNCKFGVIDMGRLEIKQIKTMMADLWDTDVLIFDIRNYPQGTAFEISRYLNNIQTDFVKFTKFDSNYPGSYSFSKYFVGNDPILPVYPGKIVILFDERTISHAEFSCMALERVPNAIKVGSTTAAADGNVAKIYLPGKLFCYATFLGVYYPDDTPTQRVGIIPDYEVHPSIAGIRAHEDEVLEFAMNCKLLNIEKNIVDKISFYPNPTSGIIHFELGETNPTTAVILDIQGRIVQKIDLKDGKRTLNISNLANGIYFIKVISPQKIYCKIIVKN